MSAERFERVDLLRGLAMVWMVAFHLAFDLHHFGLLDSRHHFHRDPLWTAQRVCIVSMFLFCAGIGQAVAMERGSDWWRFWRRWAQVVGCALLVSLGSALLFPRTWIYFGILHGISVMLVLSRCVAPLRQWLWPIGALSLLLPHFLKWPAFDHPALIWIGLGTRKPLTEDYVPLLPWIGVMLWGLALGQSLRLNRSKLLVASVPNALRSLVAVGRWPLTVYLLHQPLLIGAILAGRLANWW